MHIDLGNDLGNDRNSPDVSPTSNLVAWKIAAFVVSCALAFSGTINAVIAATAYIGGGLVGAVGSGADKALERPSETPESERLIKDADIQSVSDTAHHWALRAKLIAVAMGLVAALQLLGGVLVRKRLKTRIVPTILAIGLAGEIAFAIAFKPSIFIALGGAACAFGLVVWKKAPPAEPYQNAAGWDPIY